MNAAEHIAALAALYAPSPSELRESVNAGLSRAVDLARELHDSHGIAALALQIEGIRRTLRQLSPMLAREGNPDA